MTTPTSPAGNGRPGGTAGFTLLELLVVLILLGVTAGLVAPALVAPVPDTTQTLGVLLRSATHTAAVRGEVLWLRVEPSGAWRLDGSASLRVGPVAAGRLDGYRDPPATLVVSPVGVCGFDVASTEAAGRWNLDPATCRLTRP